MIAQFSFTPSHGLCEPQHSGWTVEEPDCFASSCIRTRERTREWATFLRSLILATDADNTRELARLGLIGRSTRAQCHVSYNCQNIHLEAKPIQPPAHDKHPVAHSCSLGNQPDVVYVSLR